MNRKQTNQNTHPEKQGDPSSLKFQKQWLNSCDVAADHCDVHPFLRRIEREEGRKASEVKA